MGVGSQSWEGMICDTRLPFSWEAWISRLFISPWGSAAGARLKGLTVERTQELASLLSQQLDEPWMLP